MLAALNHSNIGHIYGFEDGSGTSALVLELVEGQTLADRIAQGPVPVSEALPIARQMAEALEAAHEAGIIHRDLKPANVKVRDDGAVKVLDFGLAKALDPAASSSATAAMISPTMTSPAMTEMGIILGTAAYITRLRLRDIGEARILLSQPTDAATSPERPGSSAANLAFVASALALAAASALAVWYLRRPEPPPLRRVELSAAIAASPSFALSPDGSRIAYVSDGHLHVRALDALDAQDLGAVPVTADHLAWSPDGLKIGFAAAGAIHSISAGGGPAFSICKIPASGRAMDLQWLEDNSLLFSVWRDSLYSVPSTGGTPVVHVAVNPEAEIDFHGISVLPDNRLLFATHLRKGDMDLVELFDGQRRIPVTSDPTLIGFQYASGFLLFLRRTTNAGLWAVPFEDGPVDMARARLVQAGATTFHAASDGTLAYALPAPAKASFVWTDRAGAMSPVPGATVEITRSDLRSPDGRRALFIVGSQPIIVTPDGSTLIFVIDDRGRGRLRRAPLGCRWRDRIRCAGVGERRRGTERHRDRDFARWPLARVRRQAAGRQDQPVPHTVPERVRAMAARRRRHASALFALMARRSSISLVHDATNAGSRGDG